MCMASSARRLLVEVRNYVFNANVKNRIGVSLRHCSAARRMLGAKHVFGAKICSVTEAR